MREALCRRGARRPSVRIGRVTLPRIGRCVNNRLPSAEAARLSPAERRDLDALIEQRRAATHEQLEAVQEGIREREARIAEIERRDNGGTMPPQSDDPTRPDATT